MRRGYCVMAMGLTLLLGGCQVLGVHRIDIPQGTPITQERASRVQAGMTKEQVLYILGSPALVDTLNLNRWDYIYDYTAGTDAKRQGKTDIKQAGQYMTIYFDANERVARIDGIATLPSGK